MRSGRRALAARYLDERRFEDHVERDGLDMTFVSVHRSLSTYISTFHEFGAKTIPWLMTMRLKRLDGRLPVIGSRDSYGLRTILEVMAVGFRQLSPRVRRRDRLPDVR
jgi:hypothetical protein